jgi:hypothetical protein
MKTTSHLRRRHCVEGGKGTDLMIVVAECVLLKYNGTHMNNIDEMSAFDDCPSSS